MRAAIVAALLIPSALLVPAVPAYAGARYLRIVQTGSSTFWWSIAELTAFS